jgi:hypothetical protein
MVLTLSRTEEDTAPVMGPNLPPKDTKETLQRENLASLQEIVSDHLILTDALLSHISVPVSFANSDRALIRPMQHYVFDVQPTLESFFWAIAND